MDSHQKVPQHGHMEQGDRDPQPWQMGHREQGDRDPQPWQMGHMEQGDRDPQPWQMGHMEHALPNIPMENMYRRPVEGKHLNIPLTYCKAEGS